MKRILATLAACIAVLSTANLAYAQADEEKMRQEAMKEKLNAVFEKTKALPDPAGKDVLIVPTAKDGFKFKSADGNFEGSIGGRFYQHLRFYQERPDPNAGTRTSPDVFANRTGRLEMNVLFYKDFEGKVQMEMASGTAASASMQDVYLGWKGSTALSIRVGQFKAPFSQEETTSSRFIDFCERSIVSRFVPERDQGIMFYGKFAENMIEYELGFFQGVARNINDTNDEKDIALRVRVNPFIAQEGSMFKNLRIGIAMTQGDQDASAASATALDVTERELAVTFLDTNAVTVDGLRKRMGVEISWLWQSMSVRLEYIQHSQEVDIAALTDEEVKTTAWYLAVTYLLSGETKPLENRIKPTNNFDWAKGTWGAFELALRIANYEVDDDIFTNGIAAATGNSAKMQSITVGLNWWLNPNFRISPDIILLSFGDDVDMGPGHRDEKDAKGILIRFQVDF